jgi:hypothetical protein
MGTSNCANVYGHWVGLEVFWISFKQNHRFDKSIKSLRNFTQKSNFICNLHKFINFFQEVNLLLYTRGKGGSIDVGLLGENHHNLISIGGEGLLFNKGVRTPFVDHFLHRLVGWTNPWLAKVGALLKAFLQSSQGHFPHEVEGPWPVQVHLD